MKDKMGLKFDAGKIMAGLIIEDFAHALKAVATVATFGAKKYARRSWRTVPDAKDRYHDALMRHYLEHQSGEIYDPETGLTHLTHFAWNALALLELQQTELKDKKDVK